MTKTIKFTEILTDTLRTRANLNAEVIAEYAEKMKAGTEFPPGRVWKVKTKGEDGKPVEVFYLTEGEHRMAALQSIGKAEAEFEVKSGTLAEALVDALGTNDDHGLRLSNKDKRHKVLLCLENLDCIPGATDSSRYIAETCKVSAPLVEEIRTEWEMKRALDGNPVKKTRKGKDGSERTFSTKENAAAARAKWAEEKAAKKAARETAKADRLAKKKKAKEDAKIVRDQARQAKIDQAAAEKQRIKDERQAEKDRKLAEKEAAKKKPETPAFSPEFSASAGDTFPAPFPAPAPGSALDSHIGSTLIDCWRQASEEVRSAFRDYIGPALRDYIA